MEIDIDRITMQLPAGFGQRAEEISRLVADYLSTMPFTGSVKIDQISIPAITVNRNQNNHSIAEKIAGSVFEQIGGRQRAVVSEQHDSYVNVGKDNQTMTDNIQKSMPVPAKNTRVNN